MMSELRHCLVIFVLGSTLCSSPAFGQADVSVRFMAVGWQSLNQGDNQNAIACFTKAVVADPSNMQARRLLAQAKLQGGQIQQAQEIMQTVIKYDAGAESWACLGDIDFALGNSDKAQASYDRALKLSPLLGAANVGMVNVLIAKRQYAEAGQLCRAVMNKTRDKALIATLARRLQDIAEFSKAPESVPQS